MGRGGRGSRLQTRKVGMCGEVGDVLLCRYIYIYIYTIFTNVVSHIGDTVFLW